MALGEVTEWFMVPLSKFVFERDGLWFYVQNRTFVLISIMRFVRGVMSGGRGWHFVH